MSWVARRDMIKKQILQKQRNEVAQITENVQKVIKSKITSTKSVSDYPSIKSYLEIAFQGVDLSDVKIYLTSPGVMLRYGFERCAGCYIPHLNIILVKDKIKMGGNKVPQTLFNKLIQKEVAVEVDPEDVIVHELIHSISYKIGRSGNRKFVFGEEEFVYTNCVDFYRSKGMTNEEIICGTFLPFCVNDVMQDFRQMGKIWGSIGDEMPDANKINKAAMEKRVEQNAHSLSRKIIVVAKERAHTMIDLYEKHGRQRVHTNTAPNDDVSLRMKAIDMDCDF